MNCMKRQGAGVGHLRGDLGMGDRLYDLVRICCSCGMGVGFLGEERMMRGAGWWSEKWVEDWVWEWYLVQRMRIGAGNRTVWAWLLPSPEKPCPLLTSLRWSSREHLSILGMLVV